MAVAVLPPLPRRPFLALPLRAASLQPLSLLPLRRGTVPLWPIPGRPWPLSALLVPLPRLLGLLLVSIPCSLLPVTGALGPRGPLLLTFGLLLAPLLATGLTRRAVPLLGVAPRGGLSLHFGLPLSGRLTGSLGRTPGGAFLPLGPRTALEAGLLRPGRFFDRGGTRQRRPHATALV